MAKKGSKNPKARDFGKLGGRPIGEARIASAKFRDELAIHVQSKAKEYLEAIEALALGHKVFVDGEEGEEVVYHKSPDVRAWQAITDRAFGKPDQSIEHKGEMEIDFRTKIPSSAKKYGPKVRTPDVSKMGDGSK